MGDVKVLCVHLKGSGHSVVTDKQKGNLQISRPAAKTPIIEFKSVFDIIAVRDLLNDAFPPEVYASANGNKNKVQRGII